MPVSWQAIVSGAPAVAGCIDRVQGRVHGVQARLQGPWEAISQDKGFTWNAPSCSQCTRSPHTTLPLARHRLLGVSSEAQALNQALPTGCSPALAWRVPGQAVGSGDGWYPDRSTGSVGISLVMVALRW